jgi:iron complex transport system substrate-binding protein
MEAYKRIPVLSRQYPGKEQVLFMEPDLIVGWHSAFSPQNLGDPSYWNRLGVGTMILRDSAPLPKSIDNIYADLKDLGRIFKVEGKAEAKIGEIRSELESLASISAKRKQKLRVLILECFPGYRMRAWGDDSTAGQMLLSIGAENVFKKTGDQNREAIAGANPDAVIFIYMDSTLEESLRQMESFYTDPILRHTEASKSKRMGLVPLSETYCPGIRIIMGIRRMAATLFPGEAGALDEGPSAEGSY